MDRMLYIEDNRLIPAMMTLILAVGTVALLFFAVYEIMYGGEEFKLGSIGSISLLVVAATMIILSAAFFMLKLKIRVTGDSLTVGVFKGRPVLMSDIHSVTPEEYSPMKDYFGWGLRVGRKGFGYIAAGTNKGLRVNLRTGKSFFVSSKNTFEFESAMNAALKAQNKAR